MKRRVYYSRQRGAFHGSGLTLELFHWPSELLGQTDSAQTMGAPSSSPQQGRSRVESRPAPLGSAAAPVPSSGPTGRLRAAPGHGEADPNPGASSSTSAGCDAAISGYTRFAARAAERAQAEPTQSRAVSTPPGPVLTRAPRNSFCTPRRPPLPAPGSVTPAARAPTSPPTAARPPLLSARSLLAGVCS